MDKIIKYIFLFWKKTRQEIGVILFLSSVLAFYFYPALEGYKMNQSDNISYRGFASEIFNYNEDEQEIYWTGKLFSGSSTQQMQRFSVWKTPLDWLTEQVLFLEKSR
jgi:hypothetical protein